MKKQILTAACAIFLTVGVASAAAQIRITIAPPRHPREVMPPPPPEHRDWGWHAGYQRWDGNRYVWVPGAYEQTPRPRAHWVAGSWQHRHGEYVWVEGRWR